MTAERAANDCQQMVDAQLIQQTALDFDHVADSDGGEVAAIRFAGGGVETAGAGGAAAAAQQVGAEDEIAIGVYGLTRTDGDIPPPEIVLFIVPRNV